MIVHIRPDPFDKKTWYSKDAPDLCAYLAQEFDVFPSNARIYHGVVTFKNDVTPIDERGINHLQSLDGEFYVVVYPAWIQFIYYAIVAITAALSIYTYMTMPKPQVSAAQSSNNEITRRANAVRLGGRIPDIFGTVRAYPDLIAETYTYFNDNGIEIERSMLCVGSGYYLINDVKDASTDIEDIVGTSISIYDPNVSIIGNPIYRSGREFTDLPLQVIKSSAITGQSLSQPNDAKLDSTDVYFDVGGLIKLRAGSALNFTTDFASGDSIVIRNAFFGVNDYSLSGNISINQSGVVTFTSSLDINFYDLYQTIVLTGALITLAIQTGIDEFNNPIFEDQLFDLSGSYYAQSIVKSGIVYTATLLNPSSVNPAWSKVTSTETLSSGILLQYNENSIDLDGTYSIQSVAATQITLNNPELVNDDWGKVLTSTVGQIVEIGIDKINGKWIGWHNINMDGATRLTGNFTFPQGIYWTSSSGRKDPDDVIIQFEYQQLNSNNNPVGAVYNSTTRVYGKYLNPFGRTINIDLPFSGPLRFRVSRVDAVDGQGTEDCRVKAVYASKVSDIHTYNDVTVIQSEAIASDGLYAIKERKLNMLVTRKLPLNGTGALTPTTSAAQALIYLAFDSKNGRRSSFEVDVDQILNTEQEINAYFRSTKASEFSYTLDDNNLSFEEIAGMVASSCFCEPTRFGSKLRLNFEQPKEIPTLLFNHRNKVPKSEKRTQSFGVSKDYDGVQIEYTSPNDDARINYTAPETGTRNNLLKISTTGIRTEEQAKTRAWREWNKLYYQRVACEFEGLEESNLLSRNDLILVSNNTKLTTQDGDVESVDGLTLSLSQNVIIETGSSIYLQMSDGTVDIIGCVEGSAKNQVILNRAPLMPLVVDSDRYAKTTYEIINAGSETSSMFLLAEMSPQSKMTNSLKCVNYDERYYEKDHEFF